MRPKTHIYDKGLNGEIHPCQVCDRVLVDPETMKGMAVQHHVCGSNYDERCIWVCPGTIGGKCHAKIHNPTAFGLPARWAYDNFYLLPKSQAMGKKKKKKKCNHVTYFDSRIGMYKCQFCPMTFQDPQLPTKKKSVDRKVDRTPKAPKMGYEKQDPRVVRASKLKTKHDILRAKIKKCKVKEEKEAMKIALERTKSQMKDLQAEMGGGDD